MSLRLMQVDQMTHFSLFNRITNYSLLHFDRFLHHLDLILDLRQAPIQHPLDRLSLRVQLSTEGSQLVRNQPNNILLKLFCTSNISWSSCCLTKACSRRWRLDSTYFDLELTSCSYRASLSLICYSIFFYSMAEAFLRVETLWVECLGVRMHSDQISAALQSKQ